MNNIDMFFGFFMGCLVMFSLVFGIMEFFEEHTIAYKQGQVDAMNGKVLFELKSATGDSTQWMRIEK